MIIGSFAADHVIRQVRQFDWAVQQAVAVAREGYICTIGIQPSEPAVGFGYIKKAGELVVDGAPEAAFVERFVEKPDLDTAREYVDGPVLPLERGHVHLPRGRAAAGDRREPARAVRRADGARRGLGRPRRRAVPSSTGSGRRSPRSRSTTRWPSPRPTRAASPSSPGTSTGTTSGDFASLAKLNSHGRGNDLAILGENARVLSDASSGIVVSQTRRVISLIGVKDIVVVDTEDALLVTTSEHAQRVKGVVDALKLTGRGDVL